MRLSNPVFYSTTLSKSPGSAAQARLFLGRVREQLDHDTYENARLLTSELVANAVEHVLEEGEIEVRVTLDERTLRVEVIDPGPGFTHVPRGAGDDRGWGLVFAERIASRWANEPGVVWFELDRS